MKKGILFFILLFLVLAGLSIENLSFEQYYGRALTEVEALPFQEAIDQLNALENRLTDNFLHRERIYSLHKIKDQRLAEEIDHAIEADDLQYALDLLSNTNDSRREEVAREINYRNALNAEQNGLKEEALSIFSSLETYKDSKQRADLLAEQIAYQHAEEVFTGTNYDEGIAALTALGTPDALAAADQLTEKRNIHRASLQEQANGLLSAGAWHTAGIRQNIPWISGDARYGMLPAQAERTVSGLGGVFFLDHGKVYPVEEAYGCADIIASYSDIQDVAAGLTHGLFLHSDGSVSGLGSEAYGRLNVSDWSDISSIAAGAWHSIGQKTDGTVIAAGNNDYKQCDVSDWKDVISVAAGLWHTVGLKADGTLLSTGDNTYGQCNTSDWEGIVRIVCGACYTVGLKADGTVLATGDNRCGQCNVSEWTDIASISAGAFHTVAVRFDGSLIYCGRLPKELPNDPLFDSTWSASDSPQQEIIEASAYYVEGENSNLGPWLYLDQSGAVQICIDDSIPKTPFRVDILATANELPRGYVTDPSASGTIIHMPTELPQDQARKAHAVLSITGDYLGFTSNRKGVMIRNGIVYYDRAETTTAAIFPNGTIELYERGQTSADQLKSCGVRDSFSFGPILIKDGKIVYENKGSEIVITMRVALGYSDPYHFIGVVTLRDRLNQMSFSDVATVCERYGCKAAYNLDGGHSTSLVFMGKELSLVSLTGLEHKNIRGLSDIVAFLTNETVSPESE